MTVVVGAMGVLLPILVAHGVPAAVQPGLAAYINAFHGMDSSNAAAHAAPGLPHANPVFALAAGSGGGAGGGAVEL